MHKFNIIYHLGLDPKNTVLDYARINDIFLEVYLERGNYTTTLKQQIPWSGKKYDYILIWDIFPHMTKGKIKIILENAVDCMHKRSVMIATYLNRRGSREQFFYSDQEMIAMCENRGLVPTRLNFLHPEGHTILLLRKGR